MAGKRQNTTSLSLATGFLALSLSIYASPGDHTARAASAEAVPAASISDPLTPLERLNQLLEMWCLFMPCPGASESQVVTLEEVEALATTQMDAFDLSGINAGLTQDETYKSIGIVDQTEQWLVDYPELLSVSIESRLSSTLAEMRAALEERLP